MAYLHDEHGVVTENAATEGGRASEIETPPSFGHQEVSRQTFDDLFVGQEVTSVSSNVRLEDEFEEERKVEPLGRR